MGKQSESYLEGGVSVSHSHPLYCLGKPVGCDVKSRSLIPSLLQREDAVGRWALWLILDRSVLILYHHCNHRWGAAMPARQVGTGEGIVKWQLPAGASCKDCRKC